jgi:aromatic ring hydroxylase
MSDVETLWADFKNRIATADDYVNSLRGRRMNVFFMGERVPEPVDNPIIRPSVNAMAETYRIATERPDLATTHSGISDSQINRFLHVPTAPGDLVNKHEMQRELGRRTGTCFQRCVGLDAIAGGLMVTMPSEKDLQNNEVGPLIRKFLQGRDGVEVTDRMRILRLIENMTIGRNAVGYLTESLHGAGSPQAQRIQIARGMKIEDKKARARKLAGVKPAENS